MKCVIYLVVLSLNERHVHVVGRGADIFIFLAIENVNANHVNLSVSVLAGLRCRHFNNFAGATLVVK
jgi:hypothetical protein